VVKYVYILVEGVMAISYEWCDESVLVEHFKKCSRQAYHNAKKRFLHNQEILDKLQRAWTKAKEAKRNVS